MEFDEGQAAGGVACCRATAFPHRVLLPAMLCQGSGFRLWCIAKCFARLFHLGLECFAGRLPGLLLERHFATAQTLAGVLSGIFTAAALTFAGVVTLARVFFSDGAVGHPRTGIVRPFSLGFACVQTATDVLVLQQQLGIVLGGLVGGSSNQR